MTAAAFDELMTLREVAERLGSSYAVAWRLSAAGKFGKPTIVGASHLYSRDRVEAAAAAQRKAS